MLKLPYSSPAVIRACCNRYFSEGDKTQLAVSLESLLHAFLNGTGHKQSLVFLNHNHPALYFYFKLLNPFLLQAISNLNE